jgi:hypothetical protein
MHNICGTLGKRETKVLQVRELWIRLVKERSQLLDSLVIRHYLKQLLNTLCILNVRSCL